MGASQFAGPQVVGYSRSSKHVSASPQPMSGSHAATPMPGRAKARMIERLESPVDPGAVGGRRAHGSVGSVLTACVALAAAVLLVWGVASWSATQGSEDPRGAPSEANMGVLEAEATSPVSESSAVVYSPAPVLAPMPAARPPEGDTAEGLVGAGSGDADRMPGRATSAPRPKRPRAVDPSTTGASPIQAQPSQLTLERKLLARAWSALARGDLDQARGLAQEHAQKFVSPVLDVERRAIATIVGCKSKQRHWQRRANEFLVAYGKTPLAPQVRQTCELEP